MFLIVTTVVTITWFFFVVGSWNFNFLGFDMNYIICRLTVSLLGGVQKSAKIVTMHEQSPNLGHFQGGSYRI